MLSGPITITEAPELLLVVRRRVTARMRAISSRKPNGLVT